MTNFRKIHPITGFLTHIFLSEPIRKKILIFPAKNNFVVNILTPMLFLIYIIKSADVIKTEHDFCSKI